ncbi:MAG: ABC transporter substrate-binding protein [Hyphomicrobiales bacterium]
MRNKTEETSRAGTSAVRPTLVRRQVLRGALASVSALAAAAPRSARAQAPVTLTLAVWGAQAEQDGFNAVIRKYQALHPNVTIRLEVNGNGMQLYQQVDTRLAGHQAPDLFRIQYQQFGRYASARALVDLSPYVDAGYAAGFGPSFWQATNYQGKPYALPHHTDTFALYYNADILKKLDIQPPTSLERSWSWSEFIRVARAIKEKALAPYGFAMAWQTGAGYRWLPFLYQHGGQLLDADLRRPQIASPKGIETIAWTQSWFKEGLVPPSTYVKSTEQTQNLFANGTIGLLLGGDWQIPFLEKNMTKWGWGVTYMPRDVAMASDLGGNCLAVSRDSKNPDVAADFLKFIVSEENMREFVTSAQFLPVRRTMMGEDLAYALRPEAMKVFVQQSTTIPAHLVSTVTMPVFSKINAALNDELDLAFTAGQDAAETARNIEAQTRTVLGG